MIVVQIPTPDKEYLYGSDDQLTDYEIKKAEEAGVDVLVYYYASGSYEGSGVALLRKDGNWSYESLSHCSCYGPLDSISGPFEPLADLTARMSKELHGEVHPLLDAIKARGLDLT